MVQTLIETKLLIVEDDEDDFILALDYLKEITFLNLQVVRAISAAEALDKLYSDHFDLCLLDYNLGGMDGLEVLRQARENNISTSIIMLTGQEDSRLDASAQDAGAVDYLIKKDINASRFARAIRYALARREVEKERVERLKAEAESRSKSRFLAHLSHELRTPLTAILGYTELLLADRDLEDSYGELGVIFRNGKHLLNLLNDVLDLSKIAADKLELYIEQVDLENLMSDVYSLMKVAAADKGLKLRLTCSTPVPTKILGDQTRLRQILINLISNAIKFTSAGEVKIDLRYDEAGQIHFEIKDTGIGISTDKIDFIFQPFSQVVDVVAKREVGSGLGLAISQELARRLDGAISVSSKVGEGSCFTLSIWPKVDSEAVVKKLTFNTSVQLVKAFNEMHLKGSVLIVDDLDDIRQLLTHIVSNTGVAVTQASDGKQALDLVEQCLNADQMFDLVLMDIHMPGMDGSTATKLMRQLGVTVPIYALTAATMKGSKERLKGQGFTDLLSKPVDAEKLLDVLRVHLKRDNEMKNETFDGNANRKVVEMTKPENSKEESNKTGIRLLLAEDDEDAATAMKSLLEILGATVKVAHNVEQSVAAIDEEDWDMVVTDMSFPDGNGETIVEKVKNCKTSKPYLVILSGKQPNLKPEHSAVVNHTLLKPVQLDQLKSMLINFSAAKKLA